MRPLTLLILSDIHSRFERFEASAMPDTDAVLIAGDLTNDGVNTDWKPSPGFLLMCEQLGIPPASYLPSGSEYENARRWMQRLTERYPVYWIPGNHDIGFDNDTFADIPNCSGILNTTVEVAGLRIRGVSMSPGDEYMVNRWAYMTNDVETERAAYDFGPVDIVVSHCPPYGGVTDWTRSFVGDTGFHFGSRALNGYIERHSPRIVVCGHVHEGARFERIGNTDVYNCSEQWQVITL